MDNKQIIPTTLGMSYEEIENLNDVRPYDFETEREKKWYEIGLIDGREAADVKYAKFVSYEDKTYITAEWLVRNGFVKTSIPTEDYLYCNDAVEICARLKDEEAVEWKVNIQFLDHGDVQSLDICTVGQLRMFLAICGLDNLVNEFKA